MILFSELGNSNTDLDITSAFEGWGPFIQCFGNNLAHRMSNHRKEINQLASTTRECAVVDSLNK